MVKVLFVCLGNICRSPMAEGLMRQYLVQENIQEVAVYSAATSTWEHGNPVHPGTKAILQREGIDTNQMFSTPVKVSDFAEYDFIIGMDRQNVKDLKARAPHEYQDKIFLYLDAVEGHHNQDVPDPWYTGDFEETYRLLKLGLDPWKIRFLNK